jgi:dihydrofolate reductase
MLGVVEFVSLDGVMQGFHGPDERDGFRHSGWGDGYQDESQFQSAVEALPSTGAYLFGRRTYEELAQFWPFQPDDNPMAAHLNRTPKHVVTHRTEQLAWPHARRLEGELVDGVTKLKATTDGNVVVLGSGAVVEQLFAADLVDELQLFVHPLALGSGRRLFPRADQPIRLRLEGVDHTPTGVVTLRYVSAR